MIDKDTKIYCSFSSKPGNNGCHFFNNAFREREINAIYKSFYSNNIEKSIEAVKTLHISGFAVSMPFKLEVLDLVDEVTKEVNDIGSANTIVNNDGHLVAHNTDYFGVKSCLENYDFDSIYILGNGGFSKAVQYACTLLKKDYVIIGRDQRDALKQMEKELIFNATPAEFVSDNNIIIDGRPFTQSGEQIALTQAKQQFKIYTGYDYE